LSIDLPETVMPRFLLKTTVATLMITTTSLAAQSIQIGDACSYFGESLPTSALTFASVDAAASTLDSIVQATGLASNFQIQAAAVPNAVAVVQGTQRYVLYNPSFMADMNASSGTDWAAVSILAHEVGHHLNGHTLVPGGSRPTTELQADRFSGFVLQKMGANLAQATAAMAAFGSPTGSATHPARGDRLTAITQGWIQACDADATCDSSQASMNTQPVITFTDSCIINGEAVQITSQNEVISQVTGSLVGYRADTFWPGRCSFDLTSPNGGRYCVQSSGLVFSGTPNPVGQCNPL
jgi:hypothetical protein